MTGYDGVESRSLGKDKGKGIQGQGDGVTGDR